MKGTQWSIICDKRREHIGTGSLPCEPYISFIFQEILDEKIDLNPEDICDFGGQFIVPIKMKKFNSIFKTIEYIIFPELLTEYIMEINNLTYKEAAASLYGSNLSAAKKFREWYLFH